MRFVVDVESKILAIVVGGVAVIVGSLMLKYWEKIENWNLSTREMRSYDLNPLYVWMFGGLLIFVGAIFILGGIVSLFN